MSHFSGSEDGQLQSPMDNFSGDEEGDTDSLDIKPPQAASVQSRGRDSSKRKSLKEKKHSKERKHRDRERDRGEHDRSREKEKYYERGGELRERHEKDVRDIRGGPAMIDDRRHNKYENSGSFDHRNRDQRYNQHQRRDHPQPYDYHRQKNREREHTQRMTDHEFLNHQRRKYEAQYHNRQESETLEQDLRSRLLSKRNKYAKDYQRYEEPAPAMHYEKRPPHPSAQVQAHDHGEHKEREYREREYKEHKERREHVIELLDSPEVHQSSRKHKKKAKAHEKILEDPEHEARRLKLLDAEKEMAKRKEIAREELAARRERQKERTAVESSPVDDEKSKKRHRHSREHIKSKKSRRSRHQTPEEEEEEEEQDESDDDSEESSNEEDETSLSESEHSEHGSEDVDKRKVKSDNEDVDDTSMHESPLSIGDLSKSPKKHSHSVSSHRSRSRSHTKSRSRSPVSRSRSRSRASHTRSRSRSHSVSRSRSRSYSGTRSEERHMRRSPSDDDAEMKEEKKTANKEEEEADDNDLERSPRNEKGEKLPNYFPGIQGCRSVEEFQCLNRIEEGTYGVVYRAKDKRTNEIVALKRLKMEKEKEGFPITSLREINTLLKGQHPNIVTVREIVVGSNMDKIFIVMDYVEHDLKSLMETMKHKEQSFFPGEVKCLIQQLLRAVGHLHDNWILHRDLKTSNLLLSHKGILKVGDFGLAREYGSPLKHYTSLVVTLWYRAPELLLCSKEYSTPIDMWSVGCIFAEFLQMAPMFPGKSEIDQLNRIFKELGTPNEKIWPGYKELPGVVNMLSQNSQFTEYPVSNLRKRFYNKTTETGISLLQGMLTYDPKQRLTAEQALKHPYFKELPLPIDPSMFPTWPAKSELGARKALASSPKPPSGGSQFKQLTRDEILGTKGGANSHILTGAKKSMASSNTGFVLNAGIDKRQLAMGPGFSLKF